MMDGRQMDEQTIQCPYCGESLQVLVDPSEVGTEMIEDCQVCCRPIELRLEYAADGGVGRLVVGRDDA